MDKLKILITKALPNDIDLASIFSSGVEYNKSHDLVTAYALALKDCPRLNWEAYLEEYPEVKTSAISPWTYFVKYGASIGHKLKSWHPLRETVRNDLSPHVSIVINNYNNAPYLDKCITSVTNQTLTNIEIIIVDDASTDQSLEIIASYTKWDKRIKLLQHKENKGVLLARKAGVEACTGNYVMFLDSDDYYELAACETALKYIRMGYDIVQFRMHPDHLDNEDFSQPIYHSKMQLVKNLFHERTNTHYLWSRIYLREIIYAAYEQIPYTRMSMFEELLTWIMLLKLVRNCLRIPHRLYNYNCGTGMTQNLLDERKIEECFNAGKTLNFCQAYAQKNNINIDMHGLIDNYAKVFVYKLFSEIREDRIRYFYKLLLSQYSFPRILNACIDIYTKDIEQFVPKLTYCLNSSHSDRNLNFAVILDSDSLYHDKYLPRKLIEAAGAVAAKMLIILVHNSASHIKIAGKFKVRQLYAPDTNLQSLKEYMEHLKLILEADDIDTILSYRYPNAYLLWEIMTADYLNITFINILPADPAWFLIRQKILGKPKAYMDMLKCCTSVICFTQEAELFYRAKGINATYITIPVPSMIKNLPSVLSNKNLLTICEDVAFPSLSAHVFQILKEVVRHYPETKLYIAFNHVEQKKIAQFQDEARKLGLIENIVLIVNMAQLHDCFKNASLYISPFNWNYLGIDIAYALAYGLHCIIYEIAAEIAKDNSNIVVIPHNDHKRFIKAVITALDSSKNGKRKRVYNTEILKQYSSIKFNKRFASILSNCKYRCELKHYKSNIYLTLLSDLAWHSQHL